VPLLPPWPPSPPWAVRWMMKCCGARAQFVLEATKRRGFHRDFTQKNGDFTQKQWDFTKKNGISPRKMI
jgi:hypothetical protein